MACSAIQLRLVQCRDPGSGQERQFELGLRVSFLEASIRGDIDMVLIVLSIRTCSMERGGPPLPRTPRKLYFISESCDNLYDHCRPQVGRQSFDPEFPVHAVLGRARLSVNTVER